MDPHINGRWVNSLPLPNEMQTVLFFDREGFGMLGRDGSGMSFYGRFSKRSDNFHAELLFSSGVLRGQVEFLDHDNLIFLD